MEREEKCGRLESGKWRGNRKKIKKTKENSEGKEQEKREGNK